MIELLQRYPDWAVIGRMTSPIHGLPAMCQGLPSIKQIRDFLEKEMFEAQRHYELTHPPPPPPPVVVPKDFQTKAQRSEFVAGVLEKHGFAALAKQQRQRDVDKFNALCTECHVDPASVKDAPPRDVGSFKQIGNFSKGLIQNEYT